MVLEKTLESPLDCKEIQPVHSEGDQPWDFFGRNDAKADWLAYLSTPEKACSVDLTLATLVLLMMVFAFRVCEGLHGLHMT